MFLATVLATSGGIAHASIRSQPADDPVARIVPPEPINRVDVEYPAELAARDEPPRGDVLVRFVIMTDGTTRDVAVVRGLDPQLDALATDAVARLRYRPASLDGAAVEIETELAIRFEPPPRAPDTATPPDEPGPTPDATAEPRDDTPEGDEVRGPVSLRGLVLQAGQRTAIEAATITLIPAPPGAKAGPVRRREYGDPPQPRWQRVVRSDDTGSFAVSSPVGKVRVVVVAPGFERAEYIEELSTGDVLEVKYYLQRSSTNPYRTVVRSQAAEREEVARRTITPAEIRNLPGTQGDALKAIQNFPGVARAPFGLGALAIRGTSPNNSAVFLGWHEIPQLFHFGGLVSVFNSDILERIDFVPGNFDTRFGDALGGIVDVQPRAGRRDGYHGYVDSDLFDTGVLVEGKLGKGSFAIAGRRSYIDLILPAVIPKDAGINLTLAPRYWDDQILFDYPVGGGNLSVRVFGSRDRLRLVAADPNEIDTDQRNRFETQQYFHRADIVYTKRHGPWWFLITPSYRYDQLQLGLSDFLKLDLNSHNATLRAEVERRLSQRAELRVGTEFRSQFFEINVDAPPLAAMAGGDTATQIRTQVAGTIVIPALYSTITFTPTETLTVSPGVRVSYYSGLANRGAVEPRVRAAWQVADNTTLKAGVGLFADSPQPQEASAAFGNPRVGLQYAVHNSIGVSHSFPRAITIDGTVYFNYLWDEIAPSLDIVRRPDGRVGPESFANTQTGRAYGLEILARKQLTGSVFGWLAYTLNRSERRARPGESYSLFDFDQTHILTIVGVWRLPRNWQIGGRFRLVSGNPYTPVVGAVADASQGGYQPILGARNSSRMPTFHQLDLRIDKGWVWRRLQLSLYVDVQNVYNQQNTEFWNYAFDFSSRQPIASLPIIPSVGTKLEF